MAKRRIPDSPRIHVIAEGRLKRRHHHRHHRHHDRHHRHLQSGDRPAYVPPTPIQVHVTTDEVRPDSREAEPSLSVERASRAWDKAVIELPHPPPAYGRWRGSVRADPDLLHWAPSPVDPTTSALPSPTYEEAMREQQATGPPSYATRESPARRRVVREGRAELAQAQSQAVEPEMVEGRGIGVAE
jgi:hypothetical protein